MATTTTMVDLDLQEALLRLAREAPREELPALLGRVVEAEARIRLRLAEAPAATAVSAPRIIGIEEAVAIADTSARWLRTNTKGLRFRCDLSQKQPRFEEVGLRRWLAERKK